MVHYRCYHCHHRFLLLNKKTKNMSKNFFKISNKPIVVAIVVALLKPMIQPEIEYF